MNQIRRCAQIPVRAVSSLQNDHQVSPWPHHAGEYREGERTKIIVSVAVITISQTIELAIHPMITLLKLQKSSRCPTFMVKMVYAIPPTVRRERSYVRVQQAGRWERPKIADVPNWGMARTKITANTLRFAERTRILHAKNIWTLPEINAWGVKTCRSCLRYTVEMEGKAGWGAVTHHEDGVYILSEGARM